MNDPIARKRVNALIGDAKARFGVTCFVDPAGLIVTESVVEGFKKAMGGLWVGGERQRFTKQASRSVPMHRTAPHMMAITPSRFRLAMSPMSKFASDP